MTLRLPTKAELDQRAFFRARFENIVKTAAPALLDTIDQRMPPPVVEHAMKTIDALMVGLGPRLLLALMADTMVGLQVNNPQAQSEEGQIELGAWNRAFYVLANSESTYLDMAREFEEKRAAMKAAAETTEEKPKLDS